MGDELLRRADDARIGELQADVKAVMSEVRTIREMLISEPQASPLGRTLSARIDRLEERIKPVEEWYIQARGAWRTVLGLATVLSIVATFFALASYFGGR